MAGITLPNRTVRTEGIRPVNLQTDLGDLADLIEAAFANTMDAGGRAAIREMRQLSRIGAGLGVLSRLSDLAQGMSMGYVWVVDGRIVGNVSVYPADLPRDMGKGWIIANVAVYPEYQGRGIASRLMDASMNMIRSRSSGMAILQVDDDNTIARHMYRKMGFVEEGTWTQWRRSYYRATETEAPPSDLPRIKQRRLGDAPYELALAQQVRPQSQGGMDWLRPTHMDTFRLSLVKRVGNWLNLRDIQRLVIRVPEHDPVPPALLHEDPGALLGWLQIETAFGVNSRQLTFMAHPGYVESCAQALIGLAVRRFGHEGLNIHHPKDDVAVSRVLRRLHFNPTRTVVHMRCDVR